MWPPDQRLATLGARRLHVLQASWQRLRGSGMLAPPAATERVPDLVVAPQGPIRSLRDALRLAPSGALIRLEAGRYRERLRFERPVTIEGFGCRSEVLLESADESSFAMVGVTVALRGLSLHSAAPLRLESGLLVLTDCALAGSGDALLALRGPDARAQLWGCALRLLEPPALRKGRSKSAASPRCLLTVGGGAAASLGHCQCQAPNAALFEASGKLSSITLQRCALAEASSVLTLGASAELRAVHCTVSDIDQTAFSASNDTLLDLRWSQMQRVGAGIELHSGARAFCEGLCFDGAARAWLAASGANTRVEMLSCRLERAPQLLAIAERARAELVDCHLSSGGLGLLVDLAAQAELRGCTLTRCSDGVRLSRKAELALHDCVFEQNSATALSTDSGSSTRLEASVWRENHHALVFQSRSKQLVAGCRFEAQRGCAVTAGGEVELVMKNCRFESNAADLALDPRAKCKLHELSFDSASTEASPSAGAKLGHPPATKR